MNPRFSIVIPTRNGMPYLRHAVESVLISKRKDFELVVSVNGSTDDSNEFLSTIRDSRLRIITPHEELQMSQHYEFAILNSKGDWVQVLGSDDGLQAWYFEVADELISKFPRIDIFSWSRAYYYWPDSNSKEDNRAVDVKFSKRIREKSFNTSYFETLLSIKSIFDLPQTYTCTLVSRSLIDAIRIKLGGKFFHSIIPDVYSGICLLMNQNKYLHSHYPLTWVGTSPKSMSRDNKIYNEFSNSHRVDSITLASRINQSIHASEYSPYYLLEALCQYPLAGAKRSFLLHSFQAATLTAAIIRRQWKHVLSLMRPNFQNDLKPIFSMSIILPLSLLILASYGPARLIRRIFRKVHNLLRFNSEATFRAVQNGDFVGYIALNAHISLFLSRKGIIADSLK